MSRQQQALGLSIVILAAAGLAFAAWRMTATADAALCQACNRVIHANMRTVAFIGDKREAFCCPTCALSAAEQTHQTIRFEQVADFETGRTLKPTDAWAVVDSNVVPCVRDHQMLNSDGQPTTMNYDRCAPSIITFSSKAAAERFANDHGGQTGPFLEIGANLRSSAFIGGQ